MAKPQTKTHVWFELALPFGHERNSFTEIKFESPQYFAWKVYFCDLEWIPVTFRTMREGGSWTAPCEWPDQITFTLPAGYPRTSYELRQAFQITPQFTERGRRENLEQLRKRFGPMWGLGKRMPRNEQMMADWKLKQYARLANPYSPEAPREAAE